MKDLKELCEKVGDELKKPGGAVFAICVVAILLALAFVLQQCHSGP